MSRINEFGKIESGSVNEAGSIFTGDYIGENFEGNLKQGQHKEDAGSIAGVLEPPTGFGGYVGGFVGNREGNTQQASTTGYVGGFINSNSNVGGYVSEEARAKALPVKPSLWTRFKAFLFQEIDLTQEIGIELSAKEEKVLTEVHDFLFQELSFKGFMDILKIGTDRK